MKLKFFMYIKYSFIIINKIRYIIIDKIFNTIKILEYFQKIHRVQSAPYKCGKETD